MLGRLGIVVYWVAIICAVILGAIGGLVLFGSKPVFSLAFFVPAVLIWGAGRALLFILVGD